MRNMPESGSEKGTGLYNGSRGITTRGIGFILLALSFLSWALISASYMIYGTSSEYLNAPAGSFLGLMSIVLTVGGITAGGFSLPTLTRGAKVSMIASISLFSALQIAGLYILLGGLSNGISFPYGPNTYFIYLSVFSLLFILYLLIYVLFILPFLNRKGRKILLLGSAVYMAYLVVLLIFSSHLDFSPSVPNVSLHPGALIPISIQLFAPFFGFPAYVIGNVILYAQPAWAMILPLISDVIFAVLCFSIAGTRSSGVLANVGSGSTHKN